MYVLGIDVGTQGARALIVDAAGKVHAEANVAFAPTALVAGPAGAFEQRPHRWREAAMAAIRSAVQRFKEGGHKAEAIAALSVTSTSGTLCLVDAAGKPLGNAIMYSDTRASVVAEEVQAAGAELAAKLGIRFNASYGLCKLRWLQRHDPHLLARARWVLSPTDLIIGWLSGEWGQTDWTNALKWGYDVVDLRWPSFIADALHLPADKLPQVGAPGRPLGHVSQEAAAATGLSLRTLVVAGCSDGNASQLASGAASPGDWNSTLGTTLVLKGVSASLLRDPLGRIYCHRHPDGYWLPGGASSTGADCLSQRFSAERLSELNALALARSPTDLVIYPLVRRGERFPFVVPEAEGFVLGEPEDEAGYYAAHLEGLAYVERLAYEVIGELGGVVGENIYAVGGATQSLAGLQIRADVLAKSLCVPQVPLGAMGAAILAARGCAYAAVSEAARAMVRIRRVVPPREEHYEAYSARYERFLEACRQRGYLP